MTSSDRRRDSCNASPSPSPCRCLTSCRRGNDTYAGARSVSVLDEGPEGAAKLINRTRTDRHQEVALGSFVCSSGGVVSPRSLGGQVDDVAAPVCRIRSSRDDAVALAKMLRCLAPQVPRGYGLALVMA